MKYVIISTIFLILILSACQQNPIGGDRDQNGCLTGAGYSYDKSVGACTRNWEIDEHEKEVIRNVLMVQSYSSFTIVSIEEITDCEDCYDVTLQRNPIDEDTKKEKYLEPYVIPYREGRIDYSYDNPITNFDECIAAGNPAMESHPRQCRDPISDRTFIEVIENNNPLCGNNICEEGEGDLEGGCGEDADPRCLGPPDYKGTCPQDCEFTKCSENLINSEGCDDVLEPVCGKYILNTGQNTYKTFSNDCEACTSMKIDSYAKGKCEDKLFVVCDEGAKMFDPKEYAGDNNGICVERCPEGFDPYTTQIGIKLCIPHYGDKEIEQWDICEKSSDSCKCVKAYETTDEKQIEDAEYRCVPEDYAERLLFRGGIASIDENGEQSVMIA